MGGDGDTDTHTHTCFLLTNEVKSQASNHSSGFPGVKLVFWERFTQGLRERVLVIEVSLR